MFKIKYYEISIKFVNNKLHYRIEYDKNDVLVSYNDGHTLRIYEE